MEPLGAVLERLKGQLAAARPSSSQPAVTAANGIQVGCATCGPTLKCLPVFACASVLGTSKPNHKTMKGLMM